MQRISKRLLTLILPLFLLLFSSCAAKSAYDIAVEHGFVGDEAAWLASLAGQDGKDGADGRDGKDGADGQNGENGLSAYEIAVAQGFKGDEASWLASLTDDLTPAAAQSLQSVVSVLADFAYNYTSEDGIEVPLTESHAGSGVIYRLDKDKGDAYIITNYHVVYFDEALSRDHVSDEIHVMLYGREYAEYMIPAVFLGGSRQFDIAVLKVTDSELLQTAPVRQAVIANEHDAYPGTHVLAVGNAESEGISVTEGVISVVSEYVDMSAIDNVDELVTRRQIRFSAAVNHGNSGGGLFNKQGELLGIINAKKAYLGVDGFGYAIPNTIATSLADNIIAQCDGDSVRTVKRCLLGITVTFDAIHTVYDEASRHVRIIEDVKILEVSEASVAEELLKADDIIRSFTIHGTTYPITRYFMLSDLMLKARVGDEIVFELERDGAPLTVRFIIPASSASKLP